MSVIALVKQMGGRYGEFICLCGEKANYKFSASSGWCDHCDKNFIYCGGMYTVKSEGDVFSDGYIELDVDYHDSIEEIEDEERQTAS